MLLRMRSGSASSAVHRARQSERYGLALEENPIREVEGGGVERALSRTGHVRGSGPHHSDNRPARRTEARGLWRGGGHFRKGARPEFHDQVRAHHGAISLRNTRTRELEDFLRNTRACVMGSSPDMEFPHYTRAARVRVMECSRKEREA
jgi:hypothetical protein